MKTMSLKFAVGMLLASTALWGCSDDPATDTIEDENTDPTTADVVNELEPIALSRSETEAVTAGYEFAFNLLRESINEYDEANVTVSPFLMSNDWAILANGARGETQEKIVNALGFEGLDINDVNGYFKKMQEALPGHDTSANLQLANCFFQRLGAFEIKDDFISVLQDEFKADTLIVEPTEWGLTINDWVNNKTKGEIPYMFRVFDELFYMGDFTIADAFYFNGKWATPFDATDTKEGIFNNFDGSESTLQFMNMECVKDVHYDGESHMIKLYFGNGAYSAMFFLPDDNVNLDEYITSFNADKFNAIRWNSKNNVKLSLPKFDTGFYADLYDTLEKCGLDGLRSGDYSGITDENVIMGYALQGCSFRIDEEGAVSSSATLVGNVYTSADSTGTTPEDLELTFDRPFMYILMEETTGTILMTGVVKHL